MMILTMPKSVYRAIRYKKMISKSKVGKRTVHVVKRVQYHLNENAVSIHDYVSAYVSAIGE